MKKITAWMNQWFGSPELVRIVAASQDADEADKVAPLLSYPEGTEQHAYERFLIHARTLRHLGYAVIIWTPAELEDADPRRVEDRSVELGWQVIEDLQ